MDEEAVIKRTKPYSVEAEQSVIGSMILDRAAIVAATEMLKPDDFYYKHYGLMFAVMKELNNEGKPVDLVTLQERLREKNAPSEIFDIEFIRDLVSSVPTSINIRQYAQIVRDKAIMRNIIDVTEGIANDCYLGNASTQELLATTEKKIFELVKSGDSESSYTPISDVVLEAVERISAAAKSRSAITGIPTGFKDLDSMLSGLQPSDLVLIAARPSMGKTAFVLNIANQVAVKEGITTAVFSLEMPDVQLVNRMLSLQSGVDAGRIRDGRLEGSDWNKLIEGADEIAKSHLVIFDKPGVSISELRSKCRKLKLEKNLGLVIIDYLQLMSGEGRASESRQNEIAEISRALKSLAREIDAPVIALSQLSRAVEKRDDKRPMLSDLRESGAIEQDADVVMFLYRDDYYNKDTQKPGVAEVIIAKQRNGAIGTVELAWLAKQTKFADLDTGNRNH